MEREQTEEEIILAFMVSDEALEKDLEIARQTGAIKDRVPLSRVVDFRFVKEARSELSTRK